MRALGRRPRRSSAGVRTTAANGPLHVHRNSLAAQLRTWQGRADEAWAHIEAANEMDSVRNPQTQAPLRPAAALLLLAEGRYADARAAAERLPGEPDDPDMLAASTCAGYGRGRGPPGRRRRRAARLDALEERVAELDASLPEGQIRRRASSTRWR